VDAKRRPGRIFVGLLLAAAGIVFTLQGVGVLKGSFMSDTTFWSIAGPVIAVAGLALVVTGARGRAGR
jgi:hypothetical protein